MLYGIAVLLGSVSALYNFNILFVLPLTFLLLSFYLYKKNGASFRILFALCIALSSFFLTHARYQFPEESLLKKGTAEIDIVSVKIKKTPFGQVWNYKANLITFYHEGVLKAKNIPVTLSIPLDKDKDRPLGDFKYQIEANFKKTAQGGFSLSAFKGKPWVVLDNLYGLSEWRFLTKSKLQAYLNNSIRDTHVSAFLSGIVTGEFDDSLLSLELGRFGLQHLMAISGLHFSILAGLFGFLFSLVFSRKVGASCLIILMTLYFIFLGDSPSVTRSWIATVVVLSALFFERQSRSLNNLGLALFFVILFNPLAIKEIGFQFSFGVTLSIILFFAPVDTLLQKIFYKRPLSEVIRMDSLDQHGVCFLYFIRQALSLSIAVNLIALPLTLYHFQKFPLLGLIYNLFFPACVSISMFLLILSSCVSLVFPFGASYLHALNEYYTQGLLNLTFDLPRNFDVVVIRVTEFPLEILLLYVSLIFFIGIFYHSNRLSV